MPDAHLVEAAFGLLIAVLGWFLRQKDAKQEKEIEVLRNELKTTKDTLWSKHDQDVKDLAELRLHIASQHYVKTELDARFDKMEAAFTHGFHDLGGKMDKMIDALVRKTSEPKGN